MKNKNPWIQLFWKNQTKNEEYVDIMYIGKIIRLHSLQKISKLKIEIAEEGRSPSNFELQAIFPVEFDQFLWFCLGVAAYLVVYVVHIVWHLDYLGRSPSFVVRSQKCHLNTMPARRNMYSNLAFVPKKTWDASSRAKCCFEALVQTIAHE